MATTTQPTLEQIVAQAVAAALAATGTPQVKVRQARTIAARVLTGVEAQKYGDVSLGKLNGDEFQPKMGIRKGDIKPLIAALRQAEKELS